MTTARKTGRRWVSPEQHARIVALAAADPKRSHDSIAAELGLSRWTVSKHLARENFPPRLPGRRAA